MGPPVGVVHVVRDGALWFAASSSDWKVRHVDARPEVSVTVPVRRGGLLVHVAPIPPATITFRATGHVVPATDAPADVRTALLRGLDTSGAEGRGALVLVRLVPHGEFLTYGVGVSLATMRDTERARGRVLVR
ncbi:hypothetical protein [Cellulomonas bogoriensis]|uniref:hypothetical protein n=1 Tax=Cellulomonas bogoriensis TaxID=301388 RepID=UPI0012EBB278|nr:hypothetical protein [Cellulomonas bogoriensis]